MDAGDQEVLAGRCDALTLALSVLAVELSLARAKLSGESCAQVRADVTERIKEQASRLQTSLRAGGRTARACAMEEQVQLIGHILRKTVVQS